MNDGRIDIRPKDGGKLREALKALAKADGRTLRTYVIRALEDHMKKAKR